MTDRSNRAEVRNPILALPAAQRLIALPKPIRDHLVEVLIEMQRDARERAETSWRTHKAPMALYWKAVGVYAGHIARVLK